MYNEPAERRANTGLRAWPLAIGGLFVALGLSGLLDDSGIAPHDPALVVGLAVAAAALVVAGQTIHKLLGTDASALPADPAEPSETVEPLGS